MSLTFYVLFALLIICSHFTLSSQTESAPIFTSCTGNEVAWPSVSDPLYVSKVCVLVYAVQFADVAAIHFPLGEICR